MILRDCRGVDNGAIQALPTELALLELDLKGCGQLGRDGVLRACSFVHLEKLVLQGVSSVDVDALQKLRHCPNLVYLSVADCPLIDDSVFRLVGELSGLRELNVSGCSVTTWGCERGLQYPQ
ncbi:MAG: hypothetical protein IPP14_16190 [Planctomycetes bacterium]|nr:hypothetical protein [Planctomycetota bacterium]